MDDSRFPIEQALDRLDQQLGHRRLNKAWAKLEIVLGLLAMGGSFLLALWAFVRTPDVDFSAALTALILFVLGGYLALAGNRSHLYQSNNRLCAYLAELIRQSNRQA